MGTEGKGDALESVLEHIEATITFDPSNWAQWPGGWPGQIEARVRTITVGKTFPRLQPRRSGR